MNNYYCPRKELSGQAYSGKTNEYFAEVGLSHVARRRFRWTISSVTAAQFTPVEGILSILDDGAMTGTNKLGLLLAFIDLAPLVSLDSRTLSIRAIAEKLIEIHWEQVAPVRGQVLRQVSSGNRNNTVVIAEVTTLRELSMQAVGCETFEVFRLQDGLRPAWEESVKKVSVATKKNPLKYLQVLRGLPSEFLFRNKKGSVEFLPGALEDLISFGPVLRGIVQFKFAEVVRRFNFPEEEFDSLEEHLFGAERHMPGVRLRSELWRIQEGRCLYTGDRLKDPATASGSSLDHVVPWKLARLSTIENLVLTTRSTNSSKNATLLAPAPLKKWVAHEIEHRAELDSAAKEHAWPAGLSKTTELLGAFYSRPNLAVWDPAGRVVSTLGEEGREEILEGLSQLHVSCLSKNQPS